TRPVYFYTIILHHKLRFILYGYPRSPDLDQDRSLPRLNHLSTMARWRDHLLPSEVRSRQIIHTILAGTEVADAKSAILRPEVDPSAQSCRKLTSFLFSW